MTQQRKVDVSGVEWQEVDNRAPIMNQAIPYSQEAEQATLGGVIMYGDHYAAAASIIRSPEAFFILRNRYVWEAICTIGERGGLVDYVTVTQQLKDTDKLADIGGPAYLTGLVNVVMNSLEIKPYADIVARMYTRRQLLEASDKVRSLALDTTISLEEVKAGVETEIMDATAGERLNNMSNIHEAVSRFYNTLEDMERNGVPPSIPTGFDELDTLLNGGLFRRKLAILGGRPGMGKSALMINIAVNAARLGARVVFFTMEMSEEDVVRRMVAAETNVMLDKLITGKGLTPADRVKISEAMGRLAALKTHLHIDSTQNMTPLAMWGRLLELNAEYGVDLVMVDYLGIMEGNGKHRDERDRMSYLSDRLKNMKDHQKLNASFLVAAQLSRDVERRQDKRPITSDLRESGRIEENADVVAFLYRDKEYNEAIVEDVGEIIVTKNRHGRTGTAKALYMREFTKFVNF